MELDMKEWNALDCRLVFAIAVFTIERISTLIRFKDKEKERMVKRIIFVLQSVAFVLVIFAFLDYKFAIVLTILWLFLNYRMARIK